MAIRKPFTAANGILLTLSVAALIGLLLSLGPGDSSGDETPRLDHSVDYWLKGVNLTQFDASGRPSYRLQATGMAHQKHPDLHRFDQPRMQIIPANIEMAMQNRNLPSGGARSDRGTWKIQAEQGVFDPLAATTELLGPVRIERRETAAAGRISINTSDVMIDNQTQEMRSRQPITIRTDTMVTSGIGMHTDLKRQRITLLSNVSTRQQALADRQNKTPR